MSTIFSCCYLLIYFMIQVINSGSQTSWSEIAWLSFYWFSYPDYRGDECPIAIQGERKKRAQVGLVAWKLYNQFCLDSWSGTCQWSQKYLNFSIVVTHWCCDWFGLRVTVCLTELIELNHQAITWLLFTQAKVIGEIIARYLVSSVICYELVPLPVQNWHHVRSSLGVENVTLSSTFLQAKIHPYK